MGKVVILFLAAVMFGFGCITVSASGSYKEQQYRDGKCYPYAVQKHYEIDGICHYICANGNTGWYECDVF